MHPSCNPQPAQVLSHVEYLCSLPKVTQAHKEHALFSTVISHLGSAGSINVLYYLMNHAGANKRKETECVRHSRFVTTSLTTINFFFACHHTTLTVSTSFTGALGMGKDFSQQHHHLKLAVYPVPGETILHVAARSNRPRCAEWT